MVHRWPQRRNEHGVFTGGRREGESLHQCRRGGRISKNARKGHGSSNEAYLNILGDRSNPQPPIDLVVALDALEPEVPHDTFYLPDVGIEGNGHTMMLELNNEEIADFIEQWIRDNVD